MRAGHVPPQGRTRGIHVGRQEPVTRNTYVTGAPLRTGGRRVLQWLRCRCIVLLATVVGNRSGPFVSSVQRRGEPEPIYSLKGPNEGQAG